MDISGSIIARRRRSAASARSSAASAATRCGRTTRGRRLRAGAAVRCGNGGDAAAAAATTSARSEATRRGGSTRTATWRATGRATATTTAARGARADCRVYLARVDGAARAAGDGAGCYNEITIDATSWPLVPGGHAIEAIFIIIGAPQRRRPTTSATSSTSGTTARFGLGDDAAAERRADRLAMAKRGAPFRRRAVLAREALGALERNHDTHGTHRFTTALVDGRREADGAAALDEAADRRRAAAADARARRERRPS